jgi:tripartite-type tricarboxylate transporter receptor subunit TctC
MTIPRRRFLHLAAGAATLPAISGIAQAQAYPLRSVRMVLGFGAGSGQDVISRLLANGLSEIWRQPVVIENRPGVGGNVATQAVARSAPDGYTLLSSAVNFVISPFVYSSLSYDAIKDFAPVTLIGATANLMVVKSSSPVKSVQDFISYAKDNRDKVTVVLTGHWDYTALER